MVIATANPALPVAEVRPAGARFDAKDFETRTNVPIFAEHRTTAKDGRELNFGFAELQAVCDRCNRRIEETGDYATVSIGHTPPPDAIREGAVMPEMVGFCGPFRMGTMPESADGRPRYAILADLHIYTEDAVKLKKYPRRSPELWLEEKYEDMFLDPIALLGAEAPRLDMGLLYAGRRHGRTVEVYSAAAAAAASPASVFIPTDDYAATSARGQSQLGGSTMLDPQDIGQIVEALEQTDWVQFVKQQMAQQAGAADASQEGMEGMPVEAPSEEMPPADPAGMAPPEAAPMAPEGAPMAPEGPEAAVPPPDPGMAPEGAVGPEPPAEPGFGAEGEDEEYMKRTGQRRKRRFAADGEEDDEDDLEEILPPGETQDYSADGSVDADSDSPGKSTVDPELQSPGDGSVDEGSRSNPASKTYSRQGEAVRYARMQGQIDSLQGELVKNRKALATEQGIRVTAEREGVLGQLSQQYAMDFEREQNLCRYGKMTDGQFDSHVETVRLYYKRVPNGGWLPNPVEGVMGSPDRPGAPAEKERYSKNHREQAVRICEKRIDDGQRPDYMQILAGVADGSIKE